MNYLKFNQELDEYLDSHKYSFYLYTLKSNIEFLKEAKKRINPFKILNTNRIAIDYEQFVREEETLELVLEFLNSLDSNYVSYFEQSFNNGAFGFCDLQEERDIKLSNSTYIEKETKLYDVGFMGNIADGKNLVHEFFHYLNFDAYLAAPVVSELISIYIENKYLDFLLAKEHSGKDIATSRLFRYLDYDSICDKLYKNTILLNVKNELGYIDEDSYQFLIDYRNELNFPNISKNEYLSFLRILENDIAGFDKNNPNRNKKFRPDFTYRYFLGTVCSSYLLKEKNSLYDVLLLNNLLIHNQKLSGFICLELLGIDNIPFAEMIKSTNDYYKPSIITYKLKDNCRKKA